MEIVLYTPNLYIHLHDAVVVVRAVVISLRRVRGVLALPARLDGRPVDADEGVTVRALLLTSGRRDQGL